MVGYDLCSWAATEQNFICDKQIAEASLVAQAFPTASAAHTYLEDQAQSGEWGMGWQCNQWAILIGDLPGDDASKAQKALSSASTILNGAPFDDGSAAYAISQVF